MERGQGRITRRDGGRGVRPRQRYVVIGRATTRVTSPVHPTGRDGSTFVATASMTPDPGNVPAALWRRYERWNDRGTTSQATTSNPASRSIAMRVAGAK